MAASQETDHLIAEAVRMRMQRSGDVIRGQKARRSVSQPTPHSQHSFYAG